MPDDDDESIYEDEIYQSMLDLFFEGKKKPELKDILQHRSIVKLMSRLKNNKNKELAKNALIVMLSLFDDYPADLFDSIGTDLETLSEEEREGAMEKLKEIFINDEE